MGAEVAAAGAAEAGVEAEEEVEAEGLAAAGRRDGERVAGVEGLGRVLAVPRGGEAVHVARLQAGCQCSLMRVRMVVGGGGHGGGGGGGRGGGLVEEAVAAPAGQACYWLCGSGVVRVVMAMMQTTAGAVRRRRALLTPSQAHTSTGVREHPGCAQNRVPRRRVRSASSTASRSVGRSSSAMPSTSPRACRAAASAATVAAGVTRCPSGALGDRGCAVLRAQGPEGVESFRFISMFCSFACTSPCDRWGCAGIPHLQGEQRGLEVLVRGEEVAPPDKAGRLLRLPVRLQAA